MTSRNRGLFLTAGMAVVIVLALGCNGETEPAYECTTDDECDVGSICEDGACEVAVCSDVFDPVCGEDGETYGNACEARAAHVAVAHEGECVARCGTIVGIPCPDPDNQFCEFEPGNCTSADLEGVCVEVEELCPEIFEPVCGCDGQTYSNDCFRVQARVQKDHDGECDGPPVL